MVKLSNSSEKKIEPEEAFSGDNNTSVETYISEQAPKIETEELLTSSGKETTNKIITELGDDTAAEGFKEKASVIDSEINDAEVTRDEELSKLGATNATEKPTTKHTEQENIPKETSNDQMPFDAENLNNGEPEINESKIKEDLADIKLSLSALDFSPLEPSKKRIELKKLTNQLSGLFGHDINSTRAEIIKKLPEFQQTVLLMDKINDDTTLADNNSETPDITSEIGPGNTEKEISDEALERKDLDEYQIGNVHIAFDNESDENYEIEQQKRLNEWNGKDEEEKKLSIIREKDAIKNKMTKSDIEENGGEGKMPPEFYQNKEALKNYQKKLIERNKEIINANKDALENIQNQFSENNDLSGVDVGSREEIIKSMSNFMALTENMLDVERIEYLTSSLEEGQGDLSITHEDRKIEMEILEKRIEELKNIENYLKEYEKQTDENKELIKEEIISFFDKLKNNKDLLKKLAASGILIGLITLGFLTIGPGMASILAGISTEDLGIHLASAAIATAIAHRKAIIKGLKNYGPKAIWGAAALGWLLLSFDMKKMDKRMETFLQVKRPGWSYTFLAKDEKK